MYPAATSAGYRVVSGQRVPSYVPPIPQQAGQRQPSSYVPNPGPPANAMSYPVQQHSGYTVSKGGSSLIGATYSQAGPGWTTHSQQHR
mmetsp:Transcript_33546/g.76933  ORF Transcript_33546/g.76933 Transcript_33546/m.76933 type:complete len:88 (-) Transcript_33546:256-519(-)